MCEHTKAIASKYRVKPYPPGQSGYKWSDHPVQEGLPDFILGLDPAKLPHRIQGLY